MNRSKLSEIIADGMDFFDYLAICPYRISFLASPLEGIQCSFRAEVFADQPTFVSPCRYP